MPKNTTQLEPRPLNPQFNTPIIGRPRLPQILVVGYSESFTYLFTISLYSHIFLSSLFLFVNVILSRFLCFVDGYRHVMMTGRSFEIFQCQTFYQVRGVFNSILLSLLFHHYENCQSTLSLFLGAVPGFFLLSFMYEAKRVTKEVVHVCTSSATQIHCVSRSHKRCSGEQSWLSLQCRRFVAEQGAPSPPLPCPPLLLHTLSLLSFDQLFDSPHFPSFLCY